MTLETSTRLQVTFELIDKALWYVDGGAPQIIPYARAYEMLAYIACCNNMCESKVKASKDLFSEIIPNNLKVHETRLRNGTGLPQGDTRRYPLGKGSKNVWLLPTHCSSDVAEFWKLSTQAREATEIHSRMQLVRNAIERVSKWNERTHQYEILPILPGREHAWMWITKIRAMIQLEHDFLVSVLTAERLSTPQSAFELEVTAFFCAVDVTYDSSMLRALYSRTTERLGSEEGATLARHFQLLLDQDKTIRTVDELSQRLAARGVLTTISFVHMKENRVTVDLKALILLYEKSSGDII